MSNKQLKPEGNGEVRKETIKPERLASLFSNSRDLTLSSSLLNPKTNQRAQTNKKNYAPNLNVTRNRNTEKANEGPKKDQNQRGKNAKGRGGKVNNTNNKKGNLIQTVGFLSEGIAASSFPRRSGDHYGGSSTRDSIADTLQKPRIIKRDQKPDKIDLDAEKKTLIDLLGEGGDDELDLDDEDSKNSSLDDYLPIKIKTPGQRSSFAHKKLNTDLKIKTEPVDDDVAMVVTDSPENSMFNGSVTIKTEPGMEVKTEESRRMDKLFEASSDDFMLFQLPDTLPGSNRAQDATDSQATSTSSEPNLCTLDHLSEGLVGKLVRYKSGKTKLVLGETVYDVDLGLASDFNQHAVTINTNITERSSSMYSLGQIHAKFNVTPDWIHLFHKMTP